MARTRWARSACSLQTWRCGASSPTTREAGYAYRRDVQGTGWTVSLYEKQVMLSRSG
ncbi:MAG TPA: hypothetical protein VKF14_01910 [Candidatus Dormibacteraeota bacterium]|nr:hypothetical protein [Candidatus Dormibacteraeota bacterium]